MLISKSYLWGCTLGLGSARLLKELLHWLLRFLTLCSLVIGLFEPEIATAFYVEIHSFRNYMNSGLAFFEQSFRTNLGDYPNGEVPRYARFELAFDITDTKAENPYFPYDPNPPPGVEPDIGISVDALLLPPGETNWAQARILPCFIYQPMVETSRGESVAFLPEGNLEWRCRFTPDVVGTWRYKVLTADSSGTHASSEGNFECVTSVNKGFIGISEADSRFFEFADGTPFVTPLINLEEGGPFNTLADIRMNVRLMGENGIRFVRWFPTGEGASFFVAPYADTIRINWRFGDGWVTADGADIAAGKLFSYQPFYYSAQTHLLQPGYRYRLSFRAKVAGEQVLRAQIGPLADGTIDVCSMTGTYHALNGQTCTYRDNDWRDYDVIVEVGGEDVKAWEIALRGLYVSADGPVPYSNIQDGEIRVHSIRLQRDETRNGDWGGNLLTRSDPDTYAYVDQQAAARLDEILHQSEIYGVYHKLPLFHKNDSILARFLSDGTVGDWDINNFYATEGQAARWYQEAYARYFVARWSYSPALHSLELANENNFDTQAQDVAFAIAQVVHDLSPRHILMSNSFWGWWVKSFWTDPTRGHLMDYSDKHWYANETGVSCDQNGENCELISNVWDDSAAYVRECGRRFDEYRQAYHYNKPIVRGEGGVARTDTAPQHSSIARDPGGTYYHKKLWAHIGILGDTCDGEWYPRLFVFDDREAFPNANYDLFGMFAAYERFLDGEPLSNGRYIEIGVDLDGARWIAVTPTISNLRAWGVQDPTAGRMLLWIDNSAHTWKAVVDGSPIMLASGILRVPGFQPAHGYVVHWWNTDSGVVDADATTLMTSQADGTLVLEVSGLVDDVAVKVIAYRHQCYLPLIIKTTGG